jgi:hypothetical protein
MYTNISNEQIIFQLDTCAGALSPTFFGAAKPVGTAVVAVACGGFTTCFGAANPVPG